MSLTNFDSTSSMNALGMKFILAISMIDLKVNSAFDGKFIDSIGKCAMIYKVLSIVHSPFSDTPNITASAIFKEIVEIRVFDATLAIFCNAFKVATGNEVLIKNTYV